MTQVQTKLITCQTKNISALILPAMTLALIRKMKNKLTLILILFPILGFCQFDYDLFISYKTNLEQNKRLLSITEYQLDTVGKKQLSAKTYFNRFGLPDSLLQFSSNNVTSKKVLKYNDSKLISIETYKGDTHEASAEFDYNGKDQITSYTDYVYSSYDGEKLLVYYTELTYHQNGSVKKLIKMSNFKKDTIEIAEFNEKKRPIISHCKLP